MKAFAIAVAIGVFEAFMLFLLMRAVNFGHRRKTKFILLIKFVSYGIALWFLMNKYFSYYIYCFCGFIVGFPMTGLLIFVYTTLLKGKIKFPLIRKRRYFRK